MRYICGIDIGSSKIAACLGCFRRRELTSLYWDSTTAVGVKQGQWQDVGGLTDALSKLLRKLAVKSGVKIKSVYLGIANQNIVAKHSQAVIALAERGNKSITKTDIQNVNQQAQILGSCLEDEILHTEPLSYTVDNENEVINPLGLYGHKLQVDLYLISARISYINTIIEVINRLGLKLNDITLSGLAVSQAMFTPLDLSVQQEESKKGLTGFTPLDTIGQQEKGRVSLTGISPQKIKGLDILCDIGKDITQILIFNDGRLMHYQIITYGGDDLTVKLSEELKLLYSLAEEVKISYGSIQNNDETPDKEIILKKGDTYSTLSQNSVIQILTRASHRFAEGIRDAIRPYLLAISSPLIPAKATLYVSGRTACLDGFLELLEVVIGMPVKMAKIGNSSLLIPLMRQRILSGEPILNYLACLGLIAKAIKLPYKKSAQPLPDLANLMSYIPEKVKEIYQEYF